MREDAERNQPRGRDTGSARGSAEAEEAPPPRAKPTSPWPPTGHRPLQSNGTPTPEARAGRDGRQHRQRFRFRLQAVGAIPAPAQAVWESFFFFSWHHQGLTQVGATETEKELRDPNLGIRDRGGRVMSLPLSTPVSGCSCLSLPGDRVYATSGREITVFIEFRLA